MKPGQISILIGIIMPYKSNENTRWLWNYEVRSYSYSILMKIQKNKIGAAKVLLSIHHLSCHFSKFLYLPIDFYTLRPIFLCCTDTKEINEGQLHLISCVTRFAMQSSTVFICWTGFRICTASSRLGQTRQRANEAPATVCGLLVALIPCIQHPFSVSYPDWQAIHEIHQTWNMKN